MRLSPYARISVGLLGGSFNPPHHGHVAISLLARKKLRLNRIVWMVSPQNPLKSPAGMAPFVARHSACQQITRGLPITVSDLEQQWQSAYSFDTVRRLKKRFPRIRWVFLMGSDNFGQLHRWRRYQNLIRQVPLAVFGRPCYNASVKLSRVGHRYRRNRLVTPSAIRHRRVLPAWTFVSESWYHISASAIRRRLAGRSWHEVA